MNAFRTLLHQFARQPSASPRPLGGSATAVAMAAPPPPPPARRTQRATIPNPLMLLVVVLSLTSVIGYRFYNQPSLKVETRAPKTERAPYDALVLDEEATQQRRQEVLAVLKIDPEATASIQRQLHGFLADIDAARQLAGEFPFVPDTVLSLPSQRYLRSTSEGEWRQIAQAAERGGEVVGDEPSVAPTRGAETTVSEPQALGAIAGLAAQSSALAIQQAVAELRTYREQNGDSALQVLLTQILFARQGYQRALAAPDSTGIDIAPTTQQIFLDLRDETWQQTRQGMLQAAEQILAQGLPQGLPEDLKQNFVRLHLRSLVPHQVALPAAAEVLVGMLKPNLIDDKEATKQRAEQEEPVRYTVKRGEVIVRAGEVIDREAFVLLDEFGKTERGIAWRRLALTALAVTGAVGVFELVRRQTKVRLRCRDRLLICLLSLVSVSPPALEFIPLRQVNFAAAGLLVSSFYNPPVAVTQVVLLAGLTAFGSLGATTSLTNFAPLLASATSGIIAAAIAGRLRSREELAVLGGAIGFSQGATYLIAILIPSATAGTLWSVQVSSAALFGLAGLAWWVVALGVSPYLERLFDLVTPIRLAELANPNRPLLKRLATEAPGTFQHTLFVASLAEAAARELHANVELVRTGTLYHDIGKMHDPLGFIENQMGGPNKHDRINDPYQSAQIIKKHVSEGLVMARKHGLPQAVRGFIPEHQGTILISYFYFQAKQQAQGNPVNEADFRYDGPIPQSRETGIVMLADACEAALRSLKDATPETALSMVNKIFKARWQDSQLTESGLRREELPLIAEVFVRVWQQYNHQRIVYPQAALETPVSRTPL